MNQRGLKETDERLLATEPLQTLFHCGRNIARILRRNIRLMTGQKTASGEPAGVILMI